MADWEVIYRAVADFADLTQAAAKAQADMAALKKAVQDEGAAEKDAALKAAAAHDADTAAINRQTEALAKQATVAKAANEQIAFGGRSTIAQHLSDLDQERQKRDLLNRSEWMGFTSPQQAEAFRQQTMQQQLLRNRAAQMGYTTPDQYLNFLDQERARIQAQSDALKARNSVLQDTTKGYVDQANALRGVHESLGTLGSTGTQNVQGYGAALAGLPTDIRTRATFDDAQAHTDAAAYMGTVRSVPAEIRTRVTMDGVAKAISDLRQLHAEMGSGPTMPVLPPIGQTYAASRMLRGPVATTGSQLAGLAEARQAYLASQSASAPAAPQSLHDRILADLQSGALSGSPLPPQYVLRDQYGVGQSALQQALGHLRSTGALTSTGNRLYAAGGAAGGAGAAGDIIPHVTLGGKDYVLSDIRSISEALQALNSAVVSPRVEISEAQAVGALRTIGKAISDVNSPYRGLSGVNAPGLGEVQSAFKVSQALTAGAFAGDSPLSAAKAGAAADQINSKWSTLGARLGAMWRQVSSDASSAMAKITNEGGSTAQRIGAAFAALGSGGSGIGGVFGNLAQAAASSGDKMVSALAPMSAQFVGIIQLLPALDAGFGALATMFAALPQTIVAAVSAFAVLKMAIDPVIQALDAVGQLVAARQSAAANPLQTAMQQAQLANQVAVAYYSVGQANFQASQTQITDAHAVVDAQFQLQQAIHDAAVSQITDAHNVADATFAVSQAYTNAGFTQTEAAMSIASAQHSLADATFATGQAQYQLNIAWQTAREDLASLEIQVEFASANLTSAQLALEQAQQNYAQVMAQSNSTALQRAMAANQIQLAEENLAQVTQQNANNETTLNNVRQYGANQVFGVTQATQNLTDAQFAQSQAAQQVTLTQQQAANSLVVAAHDIQDALFGLWSAQTQAANDSVVNAHNVADAQFAVSQAVVVQKEGFIQSAQQQSQAAFQLQQALDQLKLGLPAFATAQAAIATAMYRLGPAAQQAVTYLTPLAVWFDTNKSIANNFFQAALPGLSKISTIIGPLSSFLGAVAKELGTLANQAITWFEKLATSSTWKQFTSTTVTDIGLLGGAVGFVVQGLQQLAQAAAPFTTWLLKGVEDLAKKFYDWAHNADTGRSNFKKWLQDVKPALDAMGGVVEAIVQGFGIIAGGPMGSPGSQQALSQFTGIMKTLSNTILPNVFNALHILSQPSIVGPMMQLFGAVSKMILVVVQTPGFQTGFQLLVDGFVHLAGFASTIITAGGPLVQIFGALAGSALAIGGILTVAKLTGILTLVTNFQALAGYAQTWYNFVSKGLSAISGGRLSLPGASTTTSGGASTDPQIIAANTQSDAAKMQLAASQNQLKAAGIEVDAADTQAAASDKEVAAADTQATAVSKGAGGFAGFLGTAAVIAIIYEILRTMINAAPVPTGPNVKAERQTMTDPNVSAAIQKNTGGAWSPVPNMSIITSLGTKIFGGNFTNALIDITNGIMSAGRWFQRELWDPVVRWNTDMHRLITQDIPGWFNQAYTAANNWFIKNMADPFDNFWEKTVPRFFTTDIPQWARDAWHAVQNWWDQYVSTPVSDFFTMTLPRFFTQDIPQWAQSAWRSVNTWWDTYVSTPVSNFFTKTIPGFFTSLPGIWDKDVATPISNFFTQTLPGVIEGAFKTSINWVITNVVNKAIGFINAVTSIVGVPAIKPVQTLASGGTVLGYSVGGASDQDTQPAMLTPGEWVIRKGARMALERSYGPGIMNRLNNFDRQHLAGGGLVGDIASFFGGLANSVGLGGVFNSITGIGSLAAQGALDTAWSGVISPLLMAVTGGTGSSSMVGATARYALGSIKKGLDTVLAAAVAPTASGGGTANPPAASAGSIQALMQSMAAARGWTGGLWTDLYNVEMAEAGFNLRAQNPTSSAYGLAQFINGPSEYYSYGGNPNTAAGQITGMLNYIASRYGNPASAWAHELAYHWYGEGGDTDHDDRHRYGHHRRHHPGSGSGGSTTPPPPLGPPSPPGLVGGPPPAAPVWSLGPLSSGLTSATPRSSDWYSAILSTAMAGGPGFAAGGPVGSLGPLLSFGVGGGIHPRFALPPGLSRAGALPARALSPAAQTAEAGSQVGLQVNGDITVNNPIPEPASQSIAHQLNRLALIAGRGNN